MFPTDGVAQSPKRWGSSYKAEESVTLTQGTRFLLYSQRSVDDGALPALAPGAVGEGTALTIVRCAEPLIGGPYYALDPDLNAVSSAKFADLWLGCDVAAGDGGRWL